MFSVIASLLLVLSHRALGNDRHINSVSDLVQFSKDVKDGMGYKGITVLLDSDLDFCGQLFTPIGDSSGRYFLGTFDGQGYALSKLKINSTSQYAGFLDAQKDRQKSKILYLILLVLFRAPMAQILIAQLMHALEELLGEFTLMTNLVQLKTL